MRHRRRQRPPWFQRPPSKPWATHWHPCGIPLRKIPTVLEVSPHPGPPPADRVVDNATNRAGGGILASHFAHVVSDSLKSRYTRRDSDIRFTGGRRGERTNLVQRMESDAGPSGPTKAPGAIRQRNCPPPLEKRWIGPA